MLIGVSCRREYGACKSVYSLWPYALTLISGWLYEDVPASSPLSVHISGRYRHCELQEYHGVNRSVPVVIFRWMLLICS